MSLLLANNVDVTKKTTAGSDAFFVAAANGHDAVMQVLYETDLFNVNAANKEGFTPLLAAALRGHLAAVDYLLGIDGVEVGKARTNGRAALHLAARE